MDTVYQQIDLFFHSVYTCKSFQKISKLKQLVYIIHSNLVARERSVIRLKRFYTI